MLTRRDVVVGMVATSLADAATLGCVVFIDSFRGRKERTMNPSDLAEADLVMLPSAHGAKETLDRLKALLARKGIAVAVEPSVDEQFATAFRDWGWTSTPRR